MFTDDDFLRAAAVLLHRAAAQALGNDRGRALLYYEVAGDLLRAQRAANVPPKPSQPEGLGDQELAALESVLSASEPDSSPVPKAEVPPAGPHGFSFGSPIARKANGADYPNALSMVQAWLSGNAPGVTADTVREAVNRELGKK